MIHKAILAAITCVGLLPAAHAVELEHLWTLEGLQEPESVAFDSESGLLYVSNINGDPGAHNGAGYIARVNLDGTVNEQHWADGLNAPKGIVVHGGQIVVSDLDRIVFIDIETANITLIVEVPEAVFLNDVAISPSGAVLVSDSGRSMIVELSNAGLGDGWTDPRLAGANGLLTDGDRIFVNTMNGQELLMTSEADRSLSLIADDLGEADGIAVLSDGSFLVSEWPGRIFSVSPRGEVETLVDTREERILINDFLLVGDVLIVPNLLPGTLTAYRVSL